MILFLILLSIDLEEILKGIEKNPYFVSKFLQTYYISEDNVVVEEGEIIFNFKKGIRFDYSNEKKSYVLIEDGFYSKEGEGGWNFTPWDKTSEEYKFFILLINGKVEEIKTIKVEKGKNEFIISSDNPSFSLILDKKNYFPLKFLLKSKDGSKNQFEFRNHKRKLKDIKI